MNFVDCSLSNISSQITDSQKMRHVLSALKDLSVLNIMQLMKVSEKLAKLNYDRFQNFETLPEKQAIYAYNGDVYNNIDIDTFDSNSVDFSQKHLRILSALYGALKPLDMIKAYRLEMSCKLSPIAPRCMNDFWKNHITSGINDELKSHKNKFLINIASNEYSSSIDTKVLYTPMINIHFRETRENILKNIAINSKKARGVLVGYIIKNQLDHPEDIKSFSKLDYKFNKRLSDLNNFYFTK